MVFATYAILWSNLEIVIFLEKMRHEHEIYFSFDFGSYSSTVAIFYLNLFKYADDGRLKSAQNRQFDKFEFRW